MRLWLLCGMGDMGLAPITLAFERQAKDAGLALGLRFQFALRQPLDLQLPPIWRIFLPYRNGRLLDLERPGKSTLAAVVLDCIRCSHRPIL